MSTMNAATDTNATLAATRAKYAPSKAAEASKPSTDDTSGTGATEALAQFVVASSYASLPDHLISYLRRLLLNNISNSAFTSVKVESSPMIDEAVCRLDDAGGSATVRGASTACSTPIRRHPTPPSSPIDWVTSG